MWIFVPVSDTEGERVNCTSTAWQYFGANDTRKTEVAFPDEEPTNATAFEELFIATNGSYLKVAAVPAERAVAVSDSLYGWTIQINLTCDQDAVVEEEDSCVIFEVDFTNYRWGRPEWHTPVPLRCSDKTHLTVTAADSR